MSDFFRFMKTKPLDTTLWIKRALIALAILLSTLVLWNAAEFIASATQAITKSQEQIQQLSLENSQLKETNRQMGLQMKELQHKAILLDSAREQIDSLKQTMEDVKGQLALVGEELKTNQATIEKLTADNHSLTVQLNVAQRTIKKLSDNNQKDQVNAQINQNIINAIFG